MIHRNLNIFIRQSYLLISFKASSFNFVFSLPSSQDRSIAWIGERCFPKQNRGSDDKDEMRMRYATNCICHMLSGGRPAYEDSFKKELQSKQWQPL